MSNQQENRQVLHGELALAAAVLINSFGVVLMLYSGCRNFCNFERAVCIFRSLYKDIPWNMDVSVSGIAGAYINDFT